MTQNDKPSLNQDQVRAALDALLSNPTAELDEDWETGQPNGRGETEPSWYREWYHDGRVTHRRQVITITGPWEAVSE